MRAKYYRISGLLFTILILSACAEKTDMERIFNENDLSGWEVKCKDTDKGKNFWYVEEGCIVANSIGDSTHDYVWLQYDEEVEEFALMFEFQAYKDSPGNSGVQIWSRYDEAEEWLNGPQIDIHPPGPWRSGMMWDETRGYQRWIFPDLPVGEWVNPDMALSNAPFYYAEDDKWNRVVISAWKGKVRVKLNDSLITDFSNFEMLSDSIHAAKNVGTKGHIALQIHSHDQLKMKFRNILLIQNKEVWEHLKLSE